MTRSFGTDVVTEILVRLPVKQLCQLKTVSKQWLLLISGPHFKMLYNKRCSKNPRILILDEESDEGRTRTIDGLICRTLHMSTVDISSSSTGVLSGVGSLDVRGRSYSPLFISNLFCYNNERGSYSVLNLPSQERVDLPNPTTFPMVGLYVGYLLDSNEYKIVRVFSLSKTYQFVDSTVQFQTLTLKDGGPIPSSWTTIDNYYKHGWDYSATSATIGSSIYWLLYSKQRNEVSILALELKTERFTNIKCCPEFRSKYVTADDGQLTEVNGRLSAALFLDGCRTLAMFVLEDAENGIWVEDFSVDLSSMDGRWFGVVGYFPANNDYNDNDLGELAFHFGDEDRQHHLLGYDVKDKRFRRLGGGELPRRFRVGTYIDRLFSLGSNSEPAALARIHSQASNV